jgi:hypothetical protein
MRVQSLSKGSGAAQRILLNGLRECGRWLSVIALVIVELTLLGCAGPTTESKSSVNQTGHQVIEESEVLIRHLLREIADLDKAISRAEVNAHQHDPLVAIDRLSQHILDSQAAVELHNRSHPSALPQHDLDDLLHQMCGDCAAERAARNAQLVEEASK